MPALRRAAPAASAATAASARRARSVVAAAQPPAPPASDAASRKTARAASPSPSSPPVPATKKAARGGARHAEPLSAPAGWRATYDLITELRRDRSAVVDSMGSEAVAHQADGGDLNFHVLISLMLSSQTKDVTNAAVMRKLRAHGLTPRNLVETSDEKLDELIHEVGFHNNKVKYIKRTCRILLDEHGGEVPRTMDEVLAFPGVGPKMAIILMRVAFDEVVGISVDTHVHRICNQLGWAGDPPAKQPEQTRRRIESWMPFEVWGDVNVLLVGFGQEIQTEKPKLLKKALASSRPAEALQLLQTCGLRVARVAKANKIEVNPEWLPEDLGPPSPATPSMIAD